jgi:hypothetical protein
MSEPLSPPPPPADPIARSGNPWDRRVQLGWVKALVECVRVFVLQPGRAWAQTLEKGDVAGPLIYALIVGWISAAIGILWQVLFGSWMLAYLPGNLQQEIGGYLVHTWVGFLAQLLLLPFYMILSLLFLSLIIHVSMLLVGGLQKSRAGFEGTLRVGAFSTVSNLANVIPIVGGIIALVWSLVLGIMGLVSLHRTTTGRATAAVFLPMLLCCLCILVVAVFAGAMVANLFSQN